MTGYKLPETLDITLSKKKTLHLKKKQDNKALAGVSQKSIYLDEEKKPYFVKLPKLRSQEAILPESIAPALYKAKQSYKLLADDTKTSPEALEAARSKYMTLQKQYDEHRLSLLKTQSFLEALSPQVTHSIFGEFVAVPENYFCRVLLEGEDNPTPIILSKGIIGFNEFLTEAPVVKSKTAVKEWDNQVLPKRADLGSVLNPESATALGKLLFISLWIGHLDVLNNINLSNSGVVRSEGTLKPAIVDWGNTMGPGFGGLSAEESASLNPDLNPNAQNKTGLSGFEHCIPFDTLVYPLLPRQLVNDLFDLTHSSDISRAMLQGFQEAYHVALNQLNRMEILISSAIETTLNEYTAMADREAMRALLSQKFYFPTENNKDAYTLVNVLKGRIDSLGDILIELQEGKSLNDIAKERIKKIISIQKQYEKPQTALTTNSVFTISKMENAKQPKVVHEDIKISQ